MTLRKHNFVVVLVIIMFGNAFQTYKCAHHIYEYYVYYIDRAFGWESSKNSMDDTLVFSKNTEKHNGHLEKVFEVLKEINCLPREENLSYL